MTKECCTRAPKKDPTMWVCIDCSAPLVKPCPDGSPRDILCSCNCPADVKCPDNFEWDSKKCMCDCKRKALLPCPDHQYFDYNICACKDAPPIPPCEGAKLGFVWKGNPTCECVCDPTLIPCPDGSPRDPKTCICQSKCPEPQIWDTVTCQCIDSVICPGASVYNPATKTCECTNPCPCDIYADYKTCECAIAAGSYIYQLTPQCCHRKDINGVWSCINCNGPEVKPCAGGFPRLQLSHCDCKCPNEQVCPAPLQWSTKKCMCECKPISVSCPVGFVFDFNSCGCKKVAIPKCFNAELGFVWKGDPVCDCICDPNAIPCPDNSPRDPVTCFCQSKCPPPKVLLLDGCCVDPVICPEPLTYNPKTQTCECSNYCPCDVYLDYSTCECAIEEDDNVWQMSKECCLVAPKSNPTAWRCILCNPPITKECLVGGPRDRFCNCNCPAEQKCPDRFAWDTKKCMCVCKPSTTACRRGKIFDWKTCSCVSQPPCECKELGFVWNGDPVCDCICDPNLIPCPDGALRDPTTCECLSKCLPPLVWDTYLCDCVDPIVCPGGSVYDPATGSCQCQIDCPCGVYYNASTCECAIEWGKYYWEMTKECCIRCDLDKFGNRIINTCICVLCDRVAKPCLSGQPRDPIKCSCESSPAEPPCDFSLPFIWDPENSICVCRPESTDCHSGQVFSFDFCKCIDLVPPSCEGAELGFVWQGEPECGCVCDPNRFRCPDGSPRDPITCLCESICPPQKCPCEQVWNPITCQCECLNVVTCSGNQVFNHEKCKCECREPCKDCKEPQVWNDETCGCRCAEKCDCDERITFWNERTCKCECISEKRCCCEDRIWSDEVG